MTKIKIGIWGRHTKEIIGYHLSLQSKSKDWQEALERAVTKGFPKGIKESLVKPLDLVSDNGCQPTSISSMKACSDLGIKQFFTS